MAKFSAHDWVRIVAADYTAIGRVVAVFEKCSPDLKTLNGQIRYVVQVKDMGLLLIQNETRLEPLSVEELLNA
jgi:hypothetical protein